MAPRDLWSTTGQEGYFAGRKKADPLACNTEAAVDVQKTIIVLILATGKASNKTSEVQALGSKGQSELAAVGMAR